MTDQRQQSLPLDIVSHISSPGTASPSTPTHGPRESLKIGMAPVHGESHTIDMLHDDVLLEIFAFCVYNPSYPVRHMGEWQRLVHVCQRWRQIIYASPRYLDLLLHCSKGSPVRSLSCWPGFPISMRYQLPDREDDVIALLKHPDRVRRIDLTITSSQFGQVVAVMQEPFPMLTHLVLCVNVDGSDQPVLPGGFLGGSAPCLREVHLDHIPFPASSTFFLSSRDLVCLHVDSIPATGYISPEAMVAGLVLLTRLETFRIIFQFPISPLEERTRRLDPPIRAVLPALVEFAFWGLSEYLEDLVTQIDTPRLDDVSIMVLDLLDTIWLPQLSLFIARTKTLRFTRASVCFSNQSFKLELDRCDRALGEFELNRPRFLLSTSFEWWGSHVAHVAYVLGQIYAMFSDMNHLYIRAGEDHPGWQDDIDSTEWLAFLHLFTVVKTLRVSGRLAGQVARAIENIPGEMVTEVLPSLHWLLFQDDDRRVQSTKHFVSLRQLRGRPVAIIDMEDIKLMFLDACRRNLEMDS